MKRTTVHYDIFPSISVEVTHVPRQKNKDLELIIAGEGRRIYKSDLTKLMENLNDLKKDLKL